ncbi:MAG: T9SS type A sorting domain-containing protein [Fidelibacterota bacterium]
MNSRNIPSLVYLLLPVLLLGQVDYYTEIQPIFNSYCISCHVSGHSSGLDLTQSASYQDLVNVESSNYAPALRVEPYAAENSVLWNKISNSGTYGSVMPPSGQIDQNHIDLISTWIDEGAWETPNTGEGDIILSLEDVEVDAYTADVIVPVNLANASDVVGGLQFDILQSPNMLLLTGVDAVGRAVGFDVSFNDFGDGFGRIVLVSTAGANIEVGDSTILELHFDGSGVPSAVVTLSLSGLIVSDPDGIELDASVGDPTTVTVGTTASLFVEGDTADAGEQVGISVSLTNGSGVGGLQFDLVDTPNDLIIDTVITTGRAEGFQVDWTEISGALRVIVWDPANGSIVTGAGEIVSITATVGSFVHAGDINLAFENVVVSDDIGGSLWIAELGTGVVTVYPGYLEPPVDLTAESGLDGHVPLTWSEPSGGGGGGGGESSYTQCFEICDDSPWDLEIEHAVDNGTGGWFRGEDGSDIPCGTGFNTCGVDVDGTCAVAVWTATGFAVDSRMITPLVDLSGYGSVVLNWWTAYSYTSYATMVNEVQVSTDGGGTWVTVYEDDPFTTGDVLIERSVDISSYVGQSIQVAFRFLDDSFGEAWFVDDIEIIGDGMISSPQRLTLNTPEVKNGLNLAAWVAGGEYDTPEVARELVAYNIYRSTTSGEGYELLDIVDPGTLEYDDTSVINGTWYFYVVSADYGEMGESGFSNEAEALPAEWINMSLSNGAALSGYVDTIFVSLENASSVSEFSFTISDVPNAVVAEAVVTTDRTSGFTVEFSELAGGSMTASFTGGEVSPGEGPVAAIAYLASSTSEVVADLLITQADASGPDGNIFIVGTQDGTFEVFIETQYAMMSGGFADPGGDGTVVLSLSNTQPIYGFEIFIIDNPEVLEGVSVSASERVPSSIVISGSETDGVYWITAVGFSEEAIEPGVGPIAEITFSVDPTAELETVVDMSFGSYQFWGPGQSEIYTLISTGDFAIGTPEALFSIGGGSAEIGGDGTYTVDLANSVDVFGFQVFIEDFPNWLTVTEVTPTDRIPADASMSWNEFTDGSLRILEFDMTPPVEAILPGEGPILTVSVNVSSGAEEGAVALSFTETAASDAEGEPTIFTFGLGNWFGIGEASIVTNTLGVIPDRYSLYQNYPNPFNPITMIVYDLPQSGYTKVIVLNLLGQEVTLLADGFQEAGQYQIHWNGRDKAGLPVNSGVYFYHVESGNFSATKKMILLK